jgi:hypothetical protein
MNHLTEEQLQMMLEENQDKASKEWLHLKNCNNCEKNYQGLLEIHHALMNMKPEDPSVRFAKNVVEKIEARLQLEKQERKWSMTMIYTLTIAILVSFLLAIYGLLKNPIHYSLDNSVWSIISSLSLTIIIFALCIWILFGIDRYFLLRYKVKKAPNN